MRAWIDIERPGQALYLLPIVRRLADAGHDVLLTTAGDLHTLAEVRAAGAATEAVGLASGSGIRRDIIEWRRRVPLLVDLAQRRGGVDVVLSGSIAALGAARTLGAPSFVLLDDERRAVVAGQLSSFLVHPSAISTHELTKRAVPRGKLLAFEGTKEDISFADVDAAAVLPLELPRSPASERRVLFVAPPPDNDRRGVDLLRALAGLDARVLYLGSGGEDGDGELESLTSWRKEPLPVQRPIPVVQLLRSVDAVISVDGTLLREAAFLGVPAYGLAGRRVGVVDRHLISLGRMQLLPSPAAAAHLELKKLAGLSPLRTGTAAADDVADLIVEHSRPASSRSTTPESPTGRRVCMIVHSHYPVGEPRGERQARAAVEAGYAVDVICLRADGQPPTEVIDDIRITHLPVAHVRSAPVLRFFGEYLRFTSLALLAVLRLNRKRRIDIVYVHAPPDFLVIAGLIPKALGSRVVLDIHDLSSHMFNIRFGGGISARAGERVLRLVERAACGVADRIVTVHEPYKEELVAHGVAPDKIAVVMNAPTPEAIESARAKAARAMRQSGFVVAYHGTVNQWYGVDLVVEALAILGRRVPDASALILGDGDALAAAEARARELRVADRIEWSRGYLPHDEALARVATASCGVIPNRRSALNRFALSSKLLEYVELGVPVAVARLETLAAHFNGDEVAFFEPGDAASLAGALEWIAQNPAEAREKSERARRRAEAYSWPTSRRRLLETLTFEP